MLPLVLALCVWWMRERIRWRDALAFAPFALISVVAGAWTIWEQKFHGIPVLRLNCQNLLPLFDALPDTTLLDQNRTHNVVNLDIIGL